MAHQTFYRIEAFIPEINRNDGFYQAVISWDYYSPVQDSRITTNQDYRFGGWYRALSKSHWGLRGILKNQGYTQLRHFFTETGYERFLEQDWKHVKEKFRSQFHFYKSNTKQFIENEVRIVGFDENQLLVAFHEDIDGYDFYHKIETPRVELAVV